MHMSLVNLFGKVHILMNSHLENVPSLTKILDLACSHRPPNIAWNASIVSLFGEARILMNSPALENVFG